MINRNKTKEIIDIEFLNEKSLEMKQALYNIEAKHKSLVELSGDGIATVNLNGIIKTVNPSFLRSTGFSIDEIIGRHITQLPTLRKKDIPGFLKIFKSIIHGKAFKNIEFIYKRKDGKERNGKASLSFYRDNGKISGVQAIFQDVTGTKKLKEDLIESEIRYRNLIEMAPDGIVTLNIKGFITLGNPAFKKLTGYSEKELLGKHFLKFPTMQLAKGVEYLKVFQAILRGKKPSRMKFNYKRKDGEIRFAEAEIKKKKKNGRISEILATCRDITKEHKAEEALKASEYKYHNLYDSSREGIFFTDMKSNVLGANKACTDMLGYSMDELKNIPFDKLTPKKCHKKEKNNTFKKLIKLGNFDENEREFIKKDGTIISVSVRRWLTLDKKGKPQGVWGFIRDITENKKAEETIKDRDRRYFTFFENSPMPITVKDLSEIKKYLDRLKEKKIKDLRKYLDSNFFRIMPSIMKIKLLEANKAILKMLEASSKEDLLNNLGKIFTKELLNYYKEAIIAYFKGKKEFSGETIFNTLKGKKVNVYMRMNIIPGSGDTLKKVLSTAIDITRQKKLDKELKECHKQLERTLSGTINALAAMAESRDPYTSGHQKRVTILAVAIAQDIGLDENIIEAVRIAALVHDIGKINVPSSILTRPGKISDIEFDMAKIHPSVGYEILKNIDFPWPIADIILQHHEKLDGSGYPKGLKEKDIKIEAKMLAVADVVEAMSSNRPYRPALGLDEAIKEITSGRGKVYDLSIVDSCLKILKGKGLSFFDH